MKLFHLIVDAEPVLQSFSPVAIAEEIARRCKAAERELPIDVYITEVQ